MGIKQKMNVKMFFKLRAIPTCKGLLRCTASWGPYLKASLLYQRETHVLMAL